MMEYTISGFVLKYFRRYCEEHFPEETESIIEKAKPIFNRMMQEAPDLGGKENWMSSNMDMTAAFFAFYEASDHRIAGPAMEQLIQWLVKDYQWLSIFTNMNIWPFIKPLYYRVYSKQAQKIEQHKANGEWTGTWSLVMNPDSRKEGIYYHMVGCPLLAFVRSHGYDELMPYVCKFDFIFEKFLHAKLIRTQTEATGGKCCDYWFVPDKSETAKKYQNFVSK